MKRFLRIVALAVTLCNISLGVAYACTCDDIYGGCTGTDQCYHDTNGLCHCSDKATEELVQ